MGKQKCQSAIFFKWSIPRCLVHPISQNPSAEPRIKMAAQVPSLEEEAMKRKERLKSMRKKSGVPNEEEVRIILHLSIVPCMETFCF